MFECIAELDFGQEAREVSTYEIDREAFEEVLAVGEFVVLLKSEIFSENACPPILKRVDVRQRITSSEQMKLLKQAQKGFRLAVVLSNAVVGLRVLELRGYERCKTVTTISLGIMRGWTAWLEKYLPEAQGALVYGHDYEPVFIFERVKKF